MDTARNGVSPAFSASISPPQLAARLGRADAPLILDVRKVPAFEAGGWVIAGALRAAPDQFPDVLAALPRERDIVVYCVHGHEVSQGTARALRESGFQACYLEGGIVVWESAGLPMMQKQGYPAIPAAPGKPTRWVTRERPKIDRIACPWLIRRFIDPTAEFLYVPEGEVLQAARAQEATPYDVPEVRFTHRGAQGELCSFDALVADFGLDDPCLQDLACIVRGADTGKPDLTPQSAGLSAISLGLSVNYSSDHAMLEQGMVIYDALYAWVKSARAEVHNADLFRKGGSPNTQ